MLFEIVGCFINNSVAVAELFISINIRQSLRSYRFKFPTRAPSFSQRKSPCVLCQVSAHRIPDFSNSVGNSSCTSRLMNFSRSSPLVKRCDMLSETICYILRISCKYKSISSLIGNMAHHSFYTLSLCNTVIF